MGSSVRVRGATRRQGGLRATRRLQRPVAQFSPFFFVTSRDILRCESEQIQRCATEAERSTAVWQFRNLVHSDAVWFRGRNDARAAKGALLQTALRSDPCQRSSVRTMVPGQLFRRFFWARGKGARQKSWGAVRRTPARGATSVDTRRLSHTDDGRTHRCREAPRHGTCSRGDLDARGSRRGASESPSSRRSRGRPSLQFSCFPTLSAGFHPIDLGVAAGRRRRRRPMPSHIVTDHLPV